MKWEFTLQAGQRWDVNATGQYIGYVSGSGEIEILVNGEPHYLGVNEVYQANEVFDKFTIRNASDYAGVIVIKTGMGRLIMSGDGQLTEVLGIRETVKTALLNPNDISAPIVSKLADFVGSVINIRKITETIKTEITNKVTASIAGTVDIRAITETLNIRKITETIKAEVTNQVTASIAGTVDIREITETIKTEVTNQVTASITGTVKTNEVNATSLAESQKTFTAGESFTIPANTNRRDITVLAAETNTDVVTVGGMPLNAGQYVTFDKYTGAVPCSAVATDQILITEVIK